MIQFYLLNETSRMVTKRIDYISHSTRDRLSAVKNASKSSFGINYVYYNCQLRADYGLFYLNHNIEQGFLS